MNTTLDSAPFVPPPYAELEGVFPPGAVPEMIYNQFLRKYEKLDDVHVFRITYTSDGLRVNGIMVLPEVIKTGGHSAVIYNRGGNREFGKLTLPQIMKTLVPLARAGYLVFASNYRGNDGGEGVEEFGGADVNDVLNLLDIARAHPGFDGNAFMLGHSRGGMMTYLAIKHGANIQAAVSVAGLSDVMAAVHERPEMEACVFQELIQDEQRDAAYQERSAVCWPEQLDKPLLLLHGDADERVGVQHSQKLLEALQRANKRDIELIVYSGGNHALVRHWDEVIARTLDWFARHRQRAAA